MALYFNNGFGKLGSDDEISKVPRNSLIVNDNKNLIFKLDNGETCNFANNIILAIASSFSQVLEDYQPKGNYLTIDDAEDYRLKTFNDFGPLELFPGEQDGTYIDFHNSGFYNSHTLPDGADGDWAARLIHWNGGAFEINCNGGIKLNNDTTINGEVFKAGYYTAGLNNNTTGHWGIEYDRQDHSVKLETYTGEHDTRWHTGGIKLTGKVVCPIYDGSLTTNAIDLGTSNYKFNNIYCTNLNGSPAQGSDYYLKTSFSSLPSQKVNAFFDSLRPLDFEFKDNLGNRSFGFIAQDIENSLKKIFGHSDFSLLRKPHDDDKYYRLYYHEFIALNTDQIQKLKKRVAAQDEYIKHLEARIAALEMKEMR